MIPLNEMPALLDEALAIRAALQNS